MLFHILAKEFQHVVMKEMCAVVRWYEQTTFYIIYQLWTTDLLNWFKLLYH